MIFYDFKLLNLKFTPWHSIGCTQGEVGTTLFIFNLGARRGWVAYTTPQPFTPRKQHWYPEYSRLGKLPGPVWVSSKRKSLTSTRYRNPDNQTLDNSLFRLCYPGPDFKGISEYVFGGPERKPQWVYVMPGNAMGDRGIVVQLPADARDSSSP